MCKEDGIEIDDRTDEEEYEYDNRTDEEIEDDLMIERHMQEQTILELVGLLRAAKIEIQNMAAKYGCSYSCELIDSIDEVLGEHN